MITSNQGAASSGGASQVNFTTPSGTNQYHGAAFWQNRNNDFAANDFFDNQDGNPLPRLNLNQTGIDVGGPIKKDKLFFYSTYELYRLKSQLEQDATILTSTRAARHFQVHQHQRPSAAGQCAGAGGQWRGPAHGPGDESLLAQVPGSSFINNYRVGDSQPGHAAEHRGLRLPGAR